MNRALFLLTLSPIAAFLPTSIAQASVSETANLINRAVCMNDWDTALTETSRLIGSPEITSHYRNILIRYRREYVDLRASRALINMSAVEDCVGVEFVHDPVEITSAPLDWERALAGMGSYQGVTSRRRSRNIAQAPRRTGTTSTTISFNPMADNRPVVAESFADNDRRNCADFSSWAAAQASFESGNSSLDGDNDGIACEIFLR